MGVFVFVYEYGHATGVNEGPVRVQSLGLDHPFTCLLPPLALLILPIAPEYCSLPSHLATPGRGRKDESPCKAAKWLAERHSRVIGRKRGAAATARCVSGRSVPRGQSLINSSSAGIFVFIYKYEYPHL